MQSVTVWTVNFNKFKMATTSLFNSHSASCSNEKHPLTFLFHSAIQHNVKVFLETDLFNDIIIFTLNNLPNLLLPDGVRKAWLLADISRCFSKSLCSTASRHSCCALNFESSGKESLWMILFKDYNCIEKRNVFKRFTSSSKTCLIPWKQSEISSILLPSLLKQLRKAFLLY